mmetsp:Transcript_7939/g.12931  ORF Transcript_7939/g.12931 Transcript_7939/m.12931 type:complete len:132 (-) Transcript_7939:520-915(-)
MLLCRGDEGPVDTSVGEANVDCGVNEDCCSSDVRIEPALLGKADLFREGPRQSSLGDKLGTACGDLGTSQVGKRDSDVASQARNGGCLAEEGRGPRTDLHNGELSLSGSGEKCLEGAAKLGGPADATHGWG